VTAEYILALDYGEKRVGVAIAHVVARFPRPLTTLQNTETLFDDITALVSKENAAQVVVGLPRGMDGGYTQQTRDAEAFAQKLADVLTLPVALADETLTSVDAENYLGGTPRNKGKIDAVAAAYILERYLSEHPAVEAKQ
jgi:putative Holliday junction resolvase